MNGLLTPTESELAGLADGTLRGAQRERLLQAIADSTELTAALHEQLRALELIDAASVEAPESIHRRLEGMFEGSHTRTSPRRSSRGLRARLPGARILAGTATGLAAVVAALALALSGGGSGPLTVQQATALALSSPTMGPPGKSNVYRSQLDVSVEGLPFPYWEERFGLRSSGARVDRLAGRMVRTVFYSDRAGRRIGYTIVSGGAVPTHGGNVHWHQGVPYRLLSQNGAAVVTWPRTGHLCVVAGQGVDATTLLHLAWWRGDRATAT